MALIDLIDVSKKFGANEILNSVSLSVNENEKIAIIGKNGSGKSTLMKIISGEVAGLQILLRTPAFSGGFDSHDLPPILFKSHF